MDETAALESHLSSAAAFVEGGIQDACDDSCSICLEAFCESDPATVTSCKHEYHLQCILEWCQRSSQCPMCWQPISLKDPTSQELLEAVEQERSFRVNRLNNSTIFHHPVLGDFELQHLRAGQDDTELEERIIQHLAAAAMGRHISRRGGHRGRSAVHGRPQYLVFSRHESNPDDDSGSTYSTHIGENEPIPAISASPVVPLAAMEEEPANHGHADQLETLLSVDGAASANSRNVSDDRISAGHPTPVSEDRAGPSDLHSFSESLKSRWHSASMRYKESITKNTRGWRERLFSRNSSIADLGSEVRREVNAGFAAVSRMMERLETKDTGPSTASPVTQTHSTSEIDSERFISSNGTTVQNGAGSSTSCVASSGPK